MNTAHDFCILFIKKKYEPARLEGKEVVSSPIDSLRIFEWLKVNAHKKVD